MASARAGRVFLTVCASFLTCPLSSRSRTLSALLCRFSSHRSEMIPLFSNALAATSSWTVGRSSRPRSAWLRWSMRSSCPARFRWRFATSTQAYRRQLLYLITPHTLSHLQRLFINNMDRGLNSRAPAHILTFYNQVHIIRFHGQTNPRSTTCLTSTQRKQAQRCLPSHQPARECPAIIATADTYARGKN